MAKATPAQITYAKTLFAQFGGSREPKWDKLSSIEVSKIIMLCRLKKKQQKG